MIHSAYEGRDHCRKIHNAYFFCNVKLPSYTARITKRDRHCVVYINTHTLTQLWIGS